MAHERLSIVGVGKNIVQHSPSTLTLADTGAQPLLNDDGSLSLAVNGEIYNHRILRKQLKNPYNFKTHSDCEVIIPLVWREQLRVRSSG